MKVLVLDTETTGLPPTKQIDPRFVHLWPHIVQLSFVVLDCDTCNMMTYGDCLLKVPSDQWSDEAAAIHGISKERMEREGISPTPALSVLMEALQDVDVIVGHNVQFDVNMVRAALIRLIQADNQSNSRKRRDGLQHSRWLHRLNQLRVECTAETTVNVCKIVAIGRSGAPYFKFPKLAELHQTLFQTVPTGLHNAFVDCLVTLRCYVLLKQHVDLLVSCRRFKLMWDKHGVTLASPTQSA